MATRTSMPCMSPITKRGNKMPIPFRKIKFRKSGRGRLHRGGGTLQIPSRIGARGPLTPVKAFAGSKQLSPLLLRRSQIRFKWHLSEARRSARVSPESALHLGYWSSPWPAERRKAAVVLQTQWRMYLARHQYRSVQHATLTIQRQWRESRRLSSYTNSASDLVEKEIGDAVLEKHNICSETDGSDDLVGANSAAESLCKELAGADGERSLNMPGISVDRLYDTNISAILEEEIFDELLSFFPCSEHDFSYSDLYHSLRTGSENRESHVAPGSPNLPESSIAGLAENNGNNLQSPLRTKAWNYDVCNLDSPACSPAKELTFARISIDGSLPPTPIKEWSSRKREPVKSSPAVPAVWNSDALDMVELHQSPTKDWASPPTRGRKSAFSLVGSSTVETIGERFQLPTEWFTDLDELDTPESCWDTSKVTSISCSPPPDPNLKPFDGFAEVSSQGCETMVSSSRALSCIPEESAHDVSPSHLDKEFNLLANFDLVVKSPISVKRMAYSSPKTTGLCRWRNTTFTEEDLDNFNLTPSAANVPTEATELGLDSPLSPALEEELLDELTKLFQGSSDPEGGPSVDISSSPPGPRRSANDIRCSDPIKSSHSKALSRVCSGALGNDSFLVHSARKLDFNFEHVDGPEDSEGNQEGCRHNGEHQMSAKKDETVLEAHRRSLSPLSMLLNFTLSEPAISSLQGSDEILDVNGQSFPRMYEEMDDVRASRDSQSYSKRCQSTVTDFLQLVEQTRYTGADGSNIPPQRGSERSPSRSPYTLQSPGPHLPTFEDEDDFCDKAVDGNIVVVKDTTYQGRDILPDPFHASTGWEVASAIESPSRNIEKPVFCASVDRYETFSRSTSTFITPKVQRSDNAVTRSCGAINKSKPPLPIKSRRISFDQINYKCDVPFTPLDEGRPVLPEKKVSERLLYNSPASPDSPFVSCSAALSLVERSSALSVSKKYFLQSPSSRMSSGKCDSDTESVASPKSLQPANIESSFEGTEKKASAKHARALFSCQESSIPKTSEDETLKSASHTEWNDVSHYSCFEDNYEAMLKQRDHHRLWFPENLSGPLLLTNGAESTDCSFRKSTSSAWDCGLMTLMTDGGLMNVENSSPSLHDLCKVWDEECMDLVTRSLKYKSLMTDSNLLGHEVKIAFEKPEPTSPQSVAWEIQNIERLKEKLENRETLQELIQQQRDTIYINIATNASMRERYRLYSKWGIRRMSRGRLRKVIYELLWKDPKRFHASADLVLQYL